MNHRNRRGSYNVMLGVLAPVVFGFAALAVDGSWMHLARTQSQDVADAGSHAALIQLRLTGSTTLSRSAADLVVSRNIVGGGSPEVGNIAFGHWDRESGGFEISLADRNAVRVGVGRYETNPMQLSFSRIWGMDEAEVQASATAATRSLHVVLVMDITQSFSDEIAWARVAAGSFLDILDETHGIDDMIGMATFTSAFGHEWTPLFLLTDSAAVGAARSQWGTLDTGSLGSDTSACYNYRRYGTIDPALFDYDDGGQRPQMPREYCDEPSTDHHTGIRMARTMLNEQNDPFAYRAMVVLTDGNPVGIKTLLLRDMDAYASDRYRIYSGPSPHSKSDIEADSVIQAEEAFDTDNINVWMVSFEATGGFLHDIPQGDGKFYYTTNPSELVPIFEEIANSMPLLIVK